MNPIAENILMHYGRSARDGAPGVGSGRYPLGSGKNPYQHGAGAEFIAKYNELRKKGKTEQQIAEEMGIINQYGKPVVSKLRAQYSIASNQVREEKINKAKELYSKGMGSSDIAREMGESESTVRDWINYSKQPNQVKVIADILREQVDEKGMIDVGSGAEKYLGCSETALNTALYSLEMEGYEVFSGRIPQVTNPGKQTTQKILGVPGTEHKDIYEYGEIHPIDEIDNYIDKDGVKRKVFEYPASMDSNRLQIRYAEEGGADKDGVIEIRRGVEDLSLGDSHYAQVRILVDGDHYLKGMAVYSDDMPDGVDVIFNTNKKSDVSKMNVLKKISDDPNNPFGSLIKEKGGQSYYDDPNGKYINEVTGKKQSLSLINKRADEGDWEDWKDKLPSQFLAKQNNELINRQLTLTKINKEAEFKEISALTNPTIKRKMLASFAEDCDAEAEHLQAAALPRQRWQVILPLTSAKDNEIYAPNFKNGEQVALVRYPHGGTFEIPILTVNNKQKEGTRVITKNAKDAVGINSNVAARLSGADFDGDTVMVIPLSKNYKITSTPPLKDLEGFDPKVEYGYADKKETKTKNGKTVVHYYDSKGREFKAMNNTQTEMGKISNLIADMTIKGASDDEIARAVKHSMVVIDAEKHGLDYVRSYEENGIKDLQKKWQSKKDGGYGGASTIITRAKSEVSVDKRRGQPTINGDGSLSYKTSDKLYYTDPKTGKEKKRTQKSTLMAETKDAYTLTSGTDNIVENSYADYANFMKSLANQARKEQISTPRSKYSESANKTYMTEVNSLNAKLNLSLTNAPKEREAQRRANIVLDKAKDNYISEQGEKMPAKEQKKIAQQALTQARNEVGASRNTINVTDREWEAIQAGAISDTKLTKIINFMDDEQLKKLATPKEGFKLTNSDVARIKRMADSGYTNSEIADAMKISISTVAEHL